MRYECSAYDPVEYLDICLEDQTTAGIIQDVNKKSIYHYMAQRGSIKCFKLIREKFNMEDLTSEDKFMNTFLGTAINYGHHDFAKYLIKEKLVNLGGFIYEEKRA